MDREKLWILVPVYEREDNLNHFLDCLKEQLYTNFKVVVVDHGPAPVRVKSGSLNIEQLRGSPSMWWSAAVNRGIRYILENSLAGAKAPLLLCNDDITFEPNYLTALLEDWQNNENRLLGSLCLDREQGRVLRANMRLDRKEARLDYLQSGAEGHLLTGRKFLPSDVLTGRGTLIPLKFFKKEGLFRETLLPHYRADYELTWRAKKRGYQVLVSTRAVVYSRLGSQFALKNNLTSKVRYLTDRRSVNNLKTVFFYSYLCYGFTYGTYFLLKNLRRIIRRMQMVKD